MDINPYRYSIPTYPLDLLMASRNLSVSNTCIPYNKPVSPMFGLPPLPPPKKKHLPVST